MINSIQIIKQFSVWQVTLEKNPIGHEQGGTRPFFVISSDKYNIASKTPIGFIMSASENKSKNKFAVSLEGMDKVSSSVNVSQIRTIRFIKIY